MQLAQALGSIHAGRVHRDGGLSYLSGTAVGMLVVATLRPSAHTSQRSPASGRGTSTSTRPAAVQAVAPPVP